MEQINTNELPQVRLYSIGPKEADLAAPLLTAEAAELIRQGEAMGLALSEGDGPVCAAACAQLLEEETTTLDLISLFVAPDFRRRKLGSTLLLELMEGMAAATVGELRRVTASFTPDAEGVEELLSLAGFQIADDDTVLTWSLPVSALADSLLMERPAAENQRLYPFTEAGEFLLKALHRELRQAAIDDLSPDELRRAIPRASYLLVDESNEPCACAVVTDPGGSRLCLSQFFTAGGSASAAMAVLRPAAQVLLEQYPDRVLEIPTLTESSAKLVRRLVPKAQSVALRRAVLEL